MGKMLMEIPIEENFQRKARGFKNVKNWHIDQAFFRAVFKSNERLNFDEKIYLNLSSRLGPF